MLCELVLRLGIALQTHGAHMLEIAFHAIATLPVVLLKANLFAPWISLGLLAVAPPSLLPRPWCPQLLLLEHDGGEVLRVTAPATFGLRLLLPIFVVKSRSFQYKTEMARYILYSKNH